MLPKYRLPNHPSAVLREEFLLPLGISQRALAGHLQISAGYVSELVNGKRGISPAVAWKFAQAFNTTPELWLNLQNAYDLAAARPRNKIARLKLVA